MDKRNILMCGPLVPPLHGQSFSFTFIAKEYLCNKKYIVNQNFSERGIIGKVLGTLRAITEYLYYFLTKKIDMVYFSSSRSVLGAVKDICLINIASVFKVKLVNHVHGYDFENLLLNRPLFFKNLVEFSYNKVHTTIVLLDCMKWPFERFKKMHIEVLPNFYDPALDESEQHMQLKHQSPVEILYFSNIMQTKGIIELIDAFILLSKSNSNVKLNIVGEFIGDKGCSAREIKTIFYERIKNEDNIIYHGILTGTEKSKMLFSNAIFILPTYYMSEAFPISIIEAMRAGCAIITTRHNCLPDIIRPENGIIVNVHDINGLVGALELLITDNELLRTIQNHNRVEAQRKYSSKTSMHLLSEILSKC
jgi:glycosyltransferase involved in cell wall biosynthesis